MKTMPARHMAEQIFFRTRGKKKPGPSVKAGAECCFPLNSCDSCAGKKKALDCIAYRLRKYGIFFCFNKNVSVRRRRKRIDSAGGDLIFLFCEGYFPSTQESEHGCSI